jgi:hypothetical protein
LHLLLATLANFTEVDTARGLLSTEKLGLQTPVKSQLGLLAATDIGVNRVNSA